MPIHRGFRIGKSGAHIRPDHRSSRVVYVINVFLACSIGNIHYAICKRVISRVSKQRARGSGSLVSILTPFKVFFTILSFNKFFSFNILNIVSSTFSLHENNCRNLRILSDIYIR